MVILYLTSSLLYTALSVFAFLYILLVILNPFVGLCVMVATIPLEEILRLPSVGTLAKLLGLLVFGAYVLQAFLYRRKIYYTKEVTYALLLLFFLSLSPLWAFYPTASLMSIPTLLMLFAFLILIPQLVDSEGKLKALILSYVVGAVVASIIGYIYFSTHPGERMRAVSNPGHYPAFLSLAIFYSLVQGILSRRLFSDFFWWALTMYLLFMSLTSGTRSALFALGGPSLFLILYLLLIKRGKASLKLLYIAITGLTIPYLVNAYFPSPLRQRFAKGMVEEGLAGRIECWKIGLVQILEHPLVGVGYGNSPLLFQSTQAIALSKYGVSINYPGSPWEPWGIAYPLYIRDIHNVYLQIWAEGGVIAFILLVLFLLSLGRLLFGKLRDLSLSPGMGQIGLVIALYFIALLIVMLSEPCFERKYLWLSFGLILAFHRVNSGRFHRGKASPCGGMAFVEDAAFSKGGSQRVK